MRSNNPYELAFEAYLRAESIPYIAVTEKLRSPQPTGRTLKSFDFIVTPPAGSSYLVDVKGRLFPSGQQRKRYWKHWTTWDDLSSLVRWQKYFGEHFCALFVFVYRVLGQKLPTTEEELFSFRHEKYAFYAIDLASYISEARLISPQWQTYELPTARFRQLAAPFDRWLQTEVPL